MIIKSYINDYSHTVKRYTEVQNQKVKITQIVAVWVRFKLEGKPIFPIQTNLLTIVFTVLISLANNKTYLAKNKTINTSV